MLAIQLLSDLKSSAFYVMPALKDQWLSLILLIKAAIFLILLSKKLHFICLDGDTHKVVQILRTRFKPDILRYFHKFTPKARSMLRQ